MRLAALLVMLCLAHVARAARAVDVYDELYRPQFHFTAKKGWLNDPNGLVYYNGQYHMFYQHNPFGEQWGNMTWGHATSTDLVHWTEHSPALAADPTGVKFSGSAVIDFNNTAGLQTGSTPTMAMFYTSVGSFDQRMAYSNDGGRSFRYYEGNPVLPTQSGGGSDRDPQVFWHEASNKWVQVVWVDAHQGNPMSYQFFGSSNLKDWNYLSEVPNYFECPDFFELPVDGNPNNKRWVLSGADGGYQVGNFDGTQFTATTPKVSQDYGNSFYASQSWHDVPSDDGRRIQVTWMNNGNYPGMPFNKQMGFPVELTLRNTLDGVRMFRNPVEEIDLLHQTEHSVNNVVYGPGQDPLGNLSGELFHIVADIELNSASSVGFNIRGNEVRYDVASQTLSALGRSAHLAPSQGRVQLEMLVDRSSLELFGGDGIVSMTSNFLPSAGNQSIDLFATGGNARVVSLSAFELASAWPAELPKPSNGLLGQWKFDEPSRAANFINAAGTEYDLANSGLVSDRPGITGKSAQLNDGGDHAYIPNDTWLNARSFTVSLWLDPSTNGAQGNIIGKTHEQTATWGLERQADGKLKFSVYTGNNSSDDLQSNVAVSANEWSHAVASYDATTGRLEMFVNGKFAGASELVIDGSPMFDDSPLMLGKRLLGQGSNQNAMLGYVDDLQMYGTALTPGQIGYLYQHPGAAIDPGSFDPATLKLVIDPATGAASIVGNGAATQLKGYSILSNAAALNGAGWQSLTDNPNPIFNGWEEANPTGAALNELNPLGSLLVGSSTELALGHPIAAQGQLPFGTRAANLDVSFQYTTADGQVQNGAVEIISGLAVNNLLLKVDPETGQAVLSNASAYTVYIGGYSILSDSGSLQPANGDWSSLSDQGVANVDEANVSAEHLSELSAPTGTGILLLPGQSYSLGAAFKPEGEGGEQDLQLEFVLNEFETLQGDYNANGVVDAADYALWRDALNSSKTLANEGATPGQVTGEDYAIWRNNFGKRARIHSQLMNGVVRYDSLAGSASAAARVPEPAAMSMLLLGLSGVAFVRRRRDFSLRASDYRQNSRSGRHAMACV
ncbi:MAG: LamG-like jellyroll fold domain-containing protein [Pirellulales bacterium]